VADQFGKKVRTSDEVQNFFCTLSVFLCLYKLKMFCELFSNYQKGW